MLLDLSDNSESYWFISIFTLHQSTLYLSPDTTYTKLPLSSRLILLFFKKMIKDTNYAPELYEF